MTPKWATTAVEVIAFYGGHSKKITDAFSLLLARQPMTKAQCQLVFDYVISEGGFDTLDKQEFEEVLDELEIKVWVS